jgi:hypothetical protein
MSGVTENPGKMSMLYMALDLSISLAASWKWADLDSW